MIINNVDVIIPTWNSMPELRRCLNRINKAFPKSVLDNVIVVDKNSKDDTVNVAREYGCTILTDNGTLGSARMTGLNFSDKDWIVFVDSDIILPNYWFIKMLNRVNNLSDNIGWFYGRTVDDFEPSRSEKLYKIKVDFKKSYRVLKKDDRPYTHNSIIRRTPLLNADITGLNSWEDYILGQTMMKQGYRIVELPVICVHQRSSTYGKWGDKTERWSVAGEIRTKGYNIKLFLKPFWYIYWGIRCTFYFKSFNHFKHNLKISIRIIKSIMNSKRFFIWNRYLN